MFVVTKDIEHKNVKTQVLELLSANVPPKKSQPISRQVRFDCFQNLESWLLFQHWQGGIGAVILRFRLASPYWQSVYIHHYMLLKCHLHLHPHLHLHLHLHVSTRTSTSHLQGFQSALVRPAFVQRMLSKAREARLGLTVAGWLAGWLPACLAAWVPGCLQNRVPYFKNDHKSWYRSWYSVDLAWYRLSNRDTGRDTL